MASTFPGPVSAFQVGTYFVGQYYQILQQKPSMVHQFYNDASTMMRFDGLATESANGMLQIHNLIMRLNVIGIEIKTAHSLESWDGGVLVMVSGFVQTKDYIARRNFVQTFFLAPQEKGFFVLNDIFQFFEEERMYQHPTAIIAHNNYETDIVSPDPIPEPVSDYILGEDIQTRDFAAPVAVQENKTVDKYSIPEPPQQIPESSETLVETPAEEATATYTTAANVLRDPSPAPAEEPVYELPKHTYASILRVAKGQPGQSVPHGASINKTAPVASEWQYTPQAAPQQSHSSATLGSEKSSFEAVEESTTHEDEGDSRSVYVGNLPPSIQASELEQEFKNFGKIRPDGVTIRSRKETGVFYAFIEFEDAIGVQNALKASPLQLNGRLIHVEGRRPNSSASRGGRRGRGRGGYHSEAPRGRFGGRTFGRFNGGQDYNDGDYNSRPRGNGYVQRNLRNGHDQTEA